MNRMTEGRKEPTILDGDNARKADCSSLAGLSLSLFRLSLLLEVSLTASSFRIVFMAEVSLISIASRGDAPADLSRISGRIWN